MIIDELEIVKRLLENDFILMNYEQTFDFLCTRTNFTDEELQYAHSLIIESV